MESDGTSLRADVSQHRLRDLRNKIKNSRRPLTLEEWIARWDSFVSYLEKGYDERASVDDYVHELWKRDKLQEQLDALPVNDQAALRMRLNAIDERFKQITRTDCRDSLTRFFEHPGDWWWYRLPQHLPEQMASMLRG